MRLCLLRAIKRQFLDLRTESRVLFIYFFFGIGFCLTLSKFFYWQVVQNDYLSSKATGQYQTVKTIEGERGKIYANDGYPLVLNKKNYLLVADPTKLEISPTDLNKILEDVFEVDYNVQITDRQKHWQPLINRLEIEAKEKIEQKSITGLTFEQFDVRSYIEASSAAHLLGFLGQDDQGNPQGYFGLEGYYDKELRGGAAQKVFEKDALMRPIGLDNFNYQPKIAGRSIVTTIDRTVQYAVEENLKSGIKKYGANSGWVIVMDPKSGAIVAMASYPSYDPTSYYNFDPELFRNPVISSGFEPGSVFKVLVMATALDTGVIAPDTICDHCYGPREISNYTIRTWNDAYFPGTNMTDVIVHSDNVGMVFVMEKLGRNNFLKYLNDLALNRITGIDLEGEIAPPVKKASDWRDIDLATASFGQGIAVTPIQLLAAVSTLASGGYWHQPYLVSDVLEGDQRIAVTHEIPRKIFKPETIKEITDMMTKAVDAGESKWAKPKGYSIAGKTGTAQIPIAGHYDPEKTVASFVGFAPVEDPKFVMLVSLKEPTTSPWGSETAAPLWFLMAKDIFRIWKIPGNGK